MEERLPKSSALAGGGSGFAVEPELLDGSELTPAETARALSDLARANKLLLGSWSLVQTLLRRIVTAGGRQRLLDVGTGTGEVADALVRRCRKRGVEVRVVGTDRKLAHLVIGRRAGTAQLRVVADARALPFRDGSFDWSCSTLFFHHFTVEENHVILHQMRRVACRGAAVVDLRGGRMIRWLTRLVLPLLGTGRVALHDGLLSARQSYPLVRVEEQIARPAGEGLLELRRRFPCRFSLLLAGWEKGSSAARRTGKMEP